MSQQHRTQEMRMKIKVRSEQDRRASQEKNKSTCHKHHERLPLLTQPLCYRDSLERHQAQCSPRAPREAAGGSLRGGGVVSCTFTARQGSRGQERSWAGARLLTEGPEPWAPPPGERDTAHVDSAPLARPERRVPPLLTAPGAALLRGRSPRGRALNLSV